MTEFEQNPLSISAHNFPASGSRDEQLRFVLGYAILAPSSHNSQPWSFRLDIGPGRAARIDLRAERSRRLTVVDPDDRELTISCGAALFNLRLALRSFGFRTRIDPVPDPSDPAFLARVHIEPYGEGSADDLELLAAIPHRITNRAAYAERPVPAALLDTLGATTAADGAWFHVAADEQERRAIAGLIAEGDRVQWANPAFRRELASWMRPDHTDARDGMPGSGFGMGELESLAAPLLIRTFDMGGGRAAKDEELAAGSPVLAVLGTAEDGPSNRLAAGQAIAHLLLLATAAGLSASFLNQPNEVPALRRQLASIIGQTGWPQMLLRLGYGPPATHTPRLAVSEVLVD